MHMQSNTILTVLLVLVSFGIGYAAGTADFFSRTIPTALNEENVRTTDTTSGTSTTSADTASSGVTLTAEQRALVESFGIDPDTVHITPAMIACAEAEVGSARLAQIQGGDKPSFTEGMKLMACYRK